MPEAIEEALPALSDQYDVEIHDIGASWTRHYEVVKSPEKVVGIVVFYGLLQEPGSELE